MIQDCLLGAILGPFWAYLGAMLECRKAYFSSTPSRIVHVRKDSYKIGLGSDKIGLIEASDGSKSAQECPRSSPRRSQEGTVSGPQGGTLIRPAGYFYRMLYFGGFLGLLGPSWGHLGANLGPSWGHLGASEGLFSSTSTRILHLRNIALQLLCKPLKTKQFYASA